jgi:hypothetical protein
MGQPLPSSYMALERLVAEKAKAKTTPVLTWNEYRDLGKLCTIEHTNDDLRAATALLHNMGSLLHFSEDEKVRESAWSCSLCVRVSEMFLCRHSCAMW